MNPLFMLFSLAKSSQIYTRTYTQTRREGKISFSRSFVRFSFHRQKKNTFFCDDDDGKTYETSFSLPFSLFGDVNNMIIKKLFETD